MQSYQQEDDIQDKQYDFGLIKRLMKYAKPYRRKVILIMILPLIGTALFLLGPRLIGLAIDNGIKVKDSRMLIMIAGAYLIVQVLHLLFSAWESYAVASLGQHIVFDIRIKTIQHLHKMSLKFYDKQPVGRLVTRMTNDINTLGEFLATAMVTVIGDVYLIAGLVVAMCWLNYKLALIAFSVIPVLIILSLYFKPKIRLAHRMIRKKIAHLIAYLSESILGMKVIQVFNQENKTQEKFKAINNEYYRIYKKAILYQSIFRPSVRLLRGVAIALLIYFGGFSALEGAITIGILVTFIDYTTHFFEPIQDLTDKYTILQSALASAERIFGILDTPIDVKNPANPMKLSDDPAGHEIVFDNVSFSYEPGKPVLKNISFKIEKNQSAALVGATGSGKSTIISLLSRFYDVDEGRILIDGIDIRNINKEELHQRLGIVLQDVFLFAGSIEENVSLWNESISHQQVKEVCRDVNASKFIEKLPKKYQSHVGERGMTISAGQRQLMSFARTMAFKPSILVLDEATSSIDVETEFFIQEAIKRMVKKLTSIIIAHRLSTVQNVDCIYVMHKGEIRERGTHQELLNKQGIYYNLYKIHAVNNHLPNQSSG